MLAPNEGTSLVAEGVISEIERKALVLLRDKLRSGEIKALEHDVPHRGLTLHMLQWYQPHRCGAVGCIAGLCYALTDGEAFPETLQKWQLGETCPWTHRHGDLISLFMPEDFGRTAAEAEHAITSFLTTGKADWGQLPNWQPNEENK